MSRSLEQVLLEAADHPPRGWRPSRVSIRTKEPSQKYLGEAALKHDQQLAQLVAEEKARDEKEREERIEKLAREVAQREQEKTEAETKVHLRARTVKAKLRRRKGDRRPKRRKVWTGPRLATLRCYCSTWRPAHSRFGKANKTTLMERAAKHLGLSVKTCMRAADYYRLWPTTRRAKGATNGEPSKRSSIE